VNYVDGVISVSAAPGGSSGSDELAATGVDASILTSLVVAGGLLVAAGMWVFPARRRIRS
jgi:LPXTG-motif cell wall-anchored protein